MARYFFTLAGAAEDETGLNLEDEQGARVQALKLAGRLLIDHAEGVEQAASLRIDVTNSANHAVCSVVVAVAKASPPASGLKLFWEELVSVNEGPDTAPGEPSTDRSQPPR